MSYSLLFCVALCLVIGFEETSGNSWGRGMSPYGNMGSRNMGGNPMGNRNRKGFERQMMGSDERLPIYLNPYTGKYQQKLPVSDQPGKAPAFGVSAPGSYGGANGMNPSQGALALLQKLAG